MTQNVVDAAALPPAVRHPRIFETFDALAPGESFVLANNHYPLPLLYQFQAERRDQFDWSVLEASPNRYRVEIRKREAAEPRAVDEYLGWDHGRLDELWAQAQAFVRSGALAEARERYGEFEIGLSRHIEAEERILFVAFERRAGRSGPTEVMRAEHARIRQAMDEIAGALVSGDAAAFEAPARALTATLGEHNSKEERVLYPMIDQIVGDGERAELVQRMQAMPA